jgi:hypothetical protein
MLNFPLLTKIFAGVGVGGSSKAHGVGMGIVIELLDRFYSLQLSGNIPGSGFPPLWPDPKRRDSELLEQATSSNLSIGGPCRVCLVLV